MFNINKISQSEYNAAEKVNQHENSPNKLQLFLIGLRIFAFALLELFKSFIKLFDEKKAVMISGQLALVTGGGNGLGRELCIRLAQEGCDIAIVDLDIKNANKTADEIQKKFKVTCKAYQCDISDYSAILKLKSDIENDMRGVDILVNNAALLYMDDFLNSNINDIEKVVHVNLTSQIIITRIFITGMIERKRGCIMAICSVGALTSSPAAIVYSGTKWGLNGFMKCLNDELLIDNHDDYIRLITVYPDVMETRKEFCETVNKVNQIIPKLNPEKVADDAVKGILGNKTSVCVSFLNTPLYFIIGSLPNSIKKFILNDVGNIKALYKK